MQIANKEIMKAILDRFETLKRIVVAVGYIGLCAFFGFAGYDLGRDLIAADKTTLKPLSEGLTESQSKIIENHLKRYGGTNAPSPFTNAPEAGRIRFKPWPQTCIVFWFNGNQSNELSFKLQNISEECRNLDQQINSPDMRATNVILREITHEPIVRRASNSWEITFRE